MRKRGDEVAESRWMGSGEKEGMEGKTADKE